MVAIRTSAATWCLAVVAGCGGTKPPVFPAVMVPDAGVGSIVTPWTSPAKTTWLCGTNAPVTPSKVAMTGTSVQAATVASDISLSIASWMSAGGKYDSVEDVSVTLSGGVLESAPLADLVVRFEQLRPGCQIAIRMQEEGGASFFAITTKVYRGDIKATVKISAKATAKAKSDAVKGLQADLGGTASLSNSSDVIVTVQGGVWIIESEPYTVPAPGSAESTPAPNAGLVREVALLREDVAGLKQRLDAGVSAQPTTPAADPPTP